MKGMGAITSIDEAEARMAGLCPIENQPDLPRPSS
jgi:hypothetical protein